MADRKNKPPPGGPAVDIEALLAENTRLRRAVEELSILNDLARSISAARNTQDVIGKVVRRVMRAISAEQAVVTLIKERPPEPTGAAGGISFTREREPDDDRAAKTYVRALASGAESEHFHLHQNLLGWMYLNKRPLLANDVASEPALRGVPMAPSLVSLLCVPLVIKSELSGVLTACNKRGGGGFTEDDQRLLAIIAAQSAQMIENARLREDEQRLVVMREQVRLARQIQLGLLPKGPPVVEGYDLAGTSVPAQEIGGDYFDFFPLTGEQLAICLGDVSGKGLPASLLMSNLQATLRGQAQLNARAEECVAWSNRLLYRSTDAEKFATLFFGILDPRLHTLEYCNAGHERPLLLSCSAAGIGTIGAGMGAAGAVVPGAETSAPPAPGPARLCKGGLVLGVLDDFPYQGETVPLAAGDLLVIYSDGVTDAVNENDEPYGESRLIDLLCSVRERAAAEIIKTVVKSVTAHAGRMPQADDVTMVAIKRLSS